MIAASVVWVIVPLGASATSGLSLGPGALALGIYVVSRLVPLLKLARSATPQPTSAIALSLLIVPLAVAILQPLLAGPAAEFSRSRAIRNSAPLIAAIEQYYAINDRSPLSP